MSASGPAEDQLTRLPGDADGQATHDWMELGFGRTSTTSTAQATPRNLLGFKDGTRSSGRHVPRPFGQIIVRTVRAADRYGVHVIVALCKEPAVVAARATCTGRSRRPRRPALATGFCITLRGRNTPAFPAAERL